MHPFLKDRRGLVPYLAVWALLAFVPATVLSAGGALGFSMGLAVALGSTLLFALLTLPAWYLCRAVRPGWRTLPRVLAAHGVAALGATTLWLALVQAAAGVTTLTPWGADVPARLTERMTAMAGLGALFYALVAAFHYLLSSLQAVGEADARAATLAVKAREAALAALRARVQPHFLFNSLNTISALISRDPALARETTVQLADFLRASLRTADGRAIRLDEELALVRTYLAVERVRLGARLVVHEDVEPGCESTRVPPLLLQPLVENAIRHGIAPLAEGGALTLEVRRAPEALVLRVSNPLDALARPRPGDGEGLRSVRERLQAAYGDEASLDIRRDPGRFEVTVRLPRSDERSAP